MCLTIDFSSSPRSLPDINAYTMSFLFCIKYAVYARNYFHQRFTICKNKRKSVFSFLLENFLWTYSIFSLT